MSPKSKHLHGLHIFLPNCINLW